MSDKDLEAAILEREREVLGSPPRLPPLTSPEAVAKALDLTARLRKAVLPNAPPLAVEQMPEIMTTLMCDPELWERLSFISLQLFGAGSLPRRDIELVFLRVSWLCQAPYEWGEHVGPAKAAGIADAEIERIIVGSAAEGWSEWDRAILQAAEELHDRAMISDRTWATLAERYTHRQLFEMLVLIGQTTLVAYVQNAMRLRLQPGNQGLRAR